MLPGMPKNPRLPAVRVVIDDCDAQLENRC
jgi:hypothetical protein